MARRTPKPRRPKAKVPERPGPIALEPVPTTAFWTSRRVALAVVALLGLHATLAVASLVRENATIDEVAHLPAGVSYWQAGTFKLYHHNPPLIKLVAALPVVLAGPETRRLYVASYWVGPFPAHPTFAQAFALLNADRYFELFTLGRLMMPIFSVLGGLVVFDWSRRLYGAGGGLLSLALWALGPNVLAHARLVTTDLGATALGVGATYLFWRYLRASTWRNALVSGLALGLAELAKFSMLLLYAIWPLLWLAAEIAHPDRAGRWRRLGRSIVQGAAIVALSILTIDLGYGFEGVGIPLGRFDFASRGLLTRPGVTPHAPTGNLLLNLSWRHRVNRFRGTILGAVPVPLPKHYLLGFDEQKIEADGLPLSWQSRRAKAGETTGYPVYLDGVHRRHGWWYYYLLALAYKVPEGTWLLVLLGLVVMIVSPRSRAPWPDEFAVWVVPVVVLGAMSVLTDINLGLRYVLPIFPYVFIATGKLAPWAEGLAGVRRSAARLILGAALLATAAVTAAIHPHYLAYFNWVSGGPDRGRFHLIDSNLDWGQDLIGLRDWLRDHHEAGPIGLAYFGQINPNIFKLRSDGFDWFLPPARPGTIRPAGREPIPGLRIPGPRLTPGLYAVSATLLQGLPFRVYDPSLQALAWAPAWQTEQDAFGYFRELTPMPESIGHSILLYRVTPEDAARLVPILEARKR